MQDLSKPVITVFPRNEPSNTNCRASSSGNFVEFQMEEIEQSIVVRFERQVRRYPNQPAIKTERYTLTYDALNKAANRVARAILAQRGESEEPVALLFEQGAQIIVALLGVLKAGKAYVALDPSHPHARLAHILEDLQTGLIVTNRKNLPLAVELAQNVCQLINIEDIDNDVSNENVDLSISPDSLAGIYYTSGSTGQPKGVVRSHRNTLHRAWLDASDHHNCPDDRQSLLFSCSFSASVTDIFGALLNGATLCPYNVKTEGVARLANWLNQEEITLFHPPATFFRQLLDSVTGEENFPKLRLIAVGGQAVYKGDVDRFQRHFSSDCILVHQLSSSETCVIRRFVIDQKTVIKSDVVPVGYAVKDKEILILDEHGQEVGFNRVGEVAVKSRYLSLGYWRRPDLTRQVFWPDSKNSDKQIYLTGDMGRMRLDGCLELLGRKDSRLKIRGYRVEVAEIEAALHDLDTIKEAVVVAREDQSGDKRLVAYLVSSGQPAPTTSALHSALIVTLPDYMIPSSFVVLEKLPLTANGKVDRQALPTPEMIRPDLAVTFVAPRTAVEETLARIWSDTLGFEQIGIHDNFFELGGQSLLAAKVISRVRSTFLVALPLRNLFDNPTIAALAKIIEITKETGAHLLDNQTEKEYLENSLRSLEMF